MRHARLSTWLVVAATWAVCPSPRQPSDCQVLRFYSSSSQLRPLKIAIKPPRKRSVNPRYEHLLTDHSSRNPTIAQGFQLKQPLPAQGRHQPSNKTASG